MTCLSVPIIHRHPCLITHTLAPPEPPVETAPDDLKVLGHSVSGGDAATAAFLSSRATSPLLNNLFAQMTAHLPMEYSPTRNNAHGSSPTRSASPTSKNRAVSFLPRAATSPAALHSTLRGQSSLVMGGLSPPMPKAMGFFDEPPVLVLPQSPVQPLVPRQPTFIYPRHISSLSDLLSHIHISLENNLLYLLSSICSLTSTPSPLSHRVVPSYSAGFVITKRTIVIYHPGAARGGGGGGAGEDSWNHDTVLNALLRNQSPLSMHPPSSHTAAAPQFYSFPNGAHDSVGDSGPQSGLGSRVGSRAESRRGSKGVESRPVSSNVSQRSLPDQPGTAAAPGQYGAVSALLRDAHSESLKAPLETANGGGGDGPVALSLVPPPHADDPPGQGPGPGQGLGDELENMSSSPFEVPHPTPHPSQMHLTPHTLSPSHIISYSSPLCLRWRKWSCCPPSSRQCQRAR